MSAPKSILITAASGKIGGHLVPLLLSQSPPPKLVLPTTNATKLKSGLPSNSGPAHNVIVAEGTVQDPLWFESILKDNNVDTVFLCLTGTDELYTALNCLDAISRAGTVKKLVYLSILGDFTSDAGFKETVRTRGYPHLFGKILIEQRLIHHDYNFQWTVLGPTVFFANDYMQKVNMLHKGELHGMSQHSTNKIAISDIALAARNVMYDTTGVWNGRKVQLAVKKLLTGAEMAELWSKALGREVKPVYATKEGAAELETQLRTFMPDVAGKGTARSIRLVYEFLEDHGISMTDSEYQDEVKLLGKDPDPYEPWVEQTAKTWLSE